MPINHTNANYLDIDSSNVVIKLMQKSWHTSPTKPLMMNKYNDDNVYALLYHFEDNLVLSNRYYVTSQLIDPKKDQSTQTLLAYAHLNLWFQLWYDWINVASEDMVCGVSTPDLLMKRLNGIHTQLMYFNHILQRVYKINQNQILPHIQLPDHDYFDDLRNVMNFELPKVGQVDDILMGHQYLSNPHWTKIYSFYRPYHKFKTYVNQMYNKLYQQLYVIENTDNGKTFLAQHRHAIQRINRQMVTTHPLDNEPIIPLPKFNPTT